MNLPVILEANNFQTGWALALKKLSENQWELWDLIVRINNPIAFQEQHHLSMTDFASEYNKIKPNQVSYTIFPYKLVKPGRNFKQICNAYLSKFYPITRRSKHSSWGTYFHRMICYKTANRDGSIVTINQLGKIIDAINASSKVHKAAYTMVICRQGVENVKPLGTPCLNTIAVRQERINGNRIISLTAFYRNHDFCERAYGNYYGLCKLLQYIASVTESEIGNFTCISSHAFLHKTNQEMRKRLLKESNNIVGSDSSVKV